jgi:hypothetical protein
MNHFSSGGDVYARRLLRDLDVSSSQAFSGCSAKGVELSRSEESDDGGLEEERDHHRLTIDPAANNAVSIRAYEKAGFRTVGIMRKYDRSPDSAWQDGLLMDILKEEF